MAARTSGSLFKATLTAERIELRLSLLRLTRRIFSTIVPMPGEPKEDAALLALPQDHCLS
jgi:hypothetical protein